MISEKADVKWASPSPFPLTKDQRSKRQLLNLCGGQFTLSTQLIIPNYTAIISRRRSTTVSLETYPFMRDGKL